MRLANRCTHPVYDFGNRYAHMRSISSNRYANIRSWTPAESVIAELCDMGTGARYTGIAWRFPPSGGREPNRIGAIWGNRCDRGESVRVQ